jgi:acyl-CoA synthetase (AMP-forming)/AMP-acid ligase II
VLVNEIIEITAAEVPEKTELVCGNQIMTYEYINSCADKVAHFLSEIGVKRHDCVAILFDNSAEAVITLFGVLKIGAVFVWISSTMKPIKRSYVLKDSGSCVMITHTNKAWTLGESIPGCDELMHVIWCNGGISDLENTVHLVCSRRLESVLQNNPSLHFKSDRF